MSFDGEGLIDITADDLPEKDKVYQVKKGDRLDQKNRKTWGYGGRVKTPKSLVATFIPTKDIEDKLKALGELLKKGSKLIKPQSMKGVQPNACTPCDALALPGRFIEYTGSVTALPMTLKSAVLQAVSTLLDVHNGFNNPGDAPPPTAAAPPAAVAAPAAADVQAAVDAQTAADVQVAVDAQAAAKADTPINTAGLEAELEVVAVPASDVDSDDDDTVANAADGSAKNLPSTGTGLPVGVVVLIGFILAVVLFVLLYLLIRWWKERRKYNDDDSHVMCSNAGEKSGKGSEDGACFDSVHSRKNTAAAAVYK
jgi:hypothetical protein